MKITGGLLEGVSLLFACAARAGGALELSEFINDPMPTPSCHATTIAESAKGLVAAWFGGSREGGKDVGIWLSRHEGNVWTPAREVANGVQTNGVRYPCWNPVLFQPRRGPLLLFYKVGPSCDRWWGMRMVSTDGGATWSAPKRLPDGIIGPVKNKPVELADGVLLCGSSEELGGWTAHMERTPDNGLTWSRTPPLNDAKKIGAIQPSLLTHADGRVQAIGRTRQGKIFSLTSGDGGKTWSPMELLDLPNPNSGIDAVTLRDGRHLLVYNPVTKGRSPLAVALSSDGRAWTNVLTLENEPGKEFSYPAVIQTADGKVHVTYTWKRLKVKHAVIDPAKLEADVSRADGGEQRVETDGLVLSGYGWSLQPLANGKKAFSNRSYVWSGLPAKTQGWRYTQTAGGEPAELVVEAHRDTTLYLAAVAGQPGIELAGWTPFSDGAFRYTDGGKTALDVFARSVKSGERVNVPQGNWSGGLLLLGAVFPPPLPPLERMSFNNPGATVDLAVGIWAWPLPMDWDGDGDLDLVVSCPDKPYNGLYVFENPTPRGVKNPMPVFKVSRRIGSAADNAQLSWVNGAPRVLTPGRVYPDFASSGFAKGVTIGGVKTNVHANGVRANQWRYTDYDGDGAMDLVIGVGDWKAYGWDNGYDAAGRWTRDLVHGYVYWVRNTGSTAEPRYAAPKLVLADGKPIDLRGRPSPCFCDFDGDGDLDLLCGEFVDGFTYFENIGARSAPRYAAGRRLKTPDGRDVKMDLEMIAPVALDWDGDGDVDLICGDEDGRVAFIENTGTFSSDHTPIFLAPRYFRQEADALKFGALSTPCACDWDGDGDTDLICGNSAGYIGFIENLSGPGVARPKWAEPKRLAAGGHTIRIMAGPNGSIQGPIEEKWGYTTVSVADWDGDGLPDILANSIWGKVVWYRNAGPRAKPVLEAARPIEVEWDGPQPELAWGWMKPDGKALLTQWRTTPVAFDWNGDGLMDLVMLDQEGYLSFFERKRVGGKLVLLPPQRVFFNERGEALRLNSGRAGGSGRRKICLTDWNGDGLTDMVVNGKNAEIWLQTGKTKGGWAFHNTGAVSRTALAGHTTSPTAADFDGDGKPDLVIGAEDGHFYFFANPRSTAR